jgi:hypothetical protein
MNFSVTRIAATMLALAGLVAGEGSVATAGLSAARCQPGGHDACLSVHGATAASTPYRPERLQDHEAGLLATAIRRSGRPRIVIYAEPRYLAEPPGAIYGYSPGYYQVGRAGLLYGPYPLNPDAPVGELRY